MVIQDIPAHSSPCHSGVWLERSKEGLSADFLEVIKGVIKGRFDVEGIQNFPGFVAHQRPALG